MAITIPVGKTDPIQPILQISMLLQQLIPDQNAAQRSRKDEILQSIDKYDIFKHLTPMISVVLLQPTITYHHPNLLVGLMSPIKDPSPL